MVELNDEVRWILGRPNFWCSPIASCLRKLGYEIRTKAEDEQAAVIHWMLSLYEVHGTAWREEGRKMLDVLKPAEPDAPEGESVKDG
jgi:hypothetical protein